MHVSEPSAHAPPCAENFPRIATSHSAMRYYIPSRFHLFLQSFVLDRFAPQARLPQLHMRSAAGTQQTTVAAQAAGTEEYIEVCTAWFRLAAVLAAHRKQMDLNMAPALEASDSSGAEQILTVCLQHKPKNHTRNALNLVKLNNCHSKR